MGLRKALGLRRKSSPPRGPDPAVVAAQLEFQRQQAEQQRRHAEAAALQKAEMDKRLQEEAQKQAALEAELAARRAEEQRPIIMRRRKVNFVNAVALHAILSTLILLVGEKGKGKTTFLHLMGLAPEPKQASDDGTKRLKERGNFLDSIGLTGWDTLYVAKLLVLILDYGKLPRDLIVFCEDRVEPVMKALGAFGIVAPLLVCLQPNDMWAGLKGGVHPTTHKPLPPRLSYTVNPEGVKEFPEEQLPSVYHGDVMDYVSKAGFGQCVTHQDLTWTNRNHSAFAPLAAKLPFKGTENLMDGTDELLLRAIFVWFVHYRHDTVDGQRRFLNDATLQEFDGDVEESDLNAILARRPQQDAAIAAERARPEG